MSVLDAAQRPVHHGVEPETKIIELMNRALSILSDAELPVLVRVSVFHFMFAYIHPFYDGNGRTNRFISSSVLSHSFNPIVGYRLSYSVKERIGKYYKGFSLCEHPLNRGDLTPFVISFSELIVNAMESMLDSLQEKQSDLADAVAAVNRAIAMEEEDAGLWRLSLLRPRYSRKTAQQLKSCAWQQRCPSPPWPRNASALRSWAF